MKNILCFFAADQNMNVLTGLVGSSNHSSYSIKSTFGIFFLNIKESSKPCMMYKSLLALFYLIYVQCTYMYEYCQILKYIFYKYEQLTDNLYGESKYYVYYCIAMESKNILHFWKKNNFVHIGQNGTVSLNHISNGQYYYRYVHC